MKLFENSTNISDDQLNQLFSKKKDTEIEIILQILSLIIYNNATNTDIVELYRILGPEKFSQVIMLFDGRQVKLPSSEEFKDCLTLSLIYYYHEIKQLPWSSIKEKFPFDISTISYGIKIKQFNNFVQQKINEFFRQLEKEDLNEKKE